MLLFDGTGNKFSETDSDSNILKILRMLDRNDTRQVHYYQVSFSSMSYIQGRLLKSYSLELARMCNPQRIHIPAPSLEQVPGSAKLEMLRLELPLTSKVISASCVEFS